jgi:Na+/H+ antiporter NhaC
MKNLIKFSPIIVLGTLLINGVDILSAAPIAVVLAIIIAMTIEKLTFDDLLESGVDRVRGVSMIFFVIMFAYALAEIFLSTGVGAAIIILSLKLGVTGKSVAVVAFLVTCVLAVGTGTSWGTFAAAAPIFLWLTYIVGGDVVLTACSVAGGSCFGDNIGLISDTTVLSSGMQNVEVVHRIRHQGVWSGLCLVLASICIVATGFAMDLPNTIGNPAEAIAAIPSEALVALAAERASAVALLEQVEAGVPMYMTIPLILVLGLAVKGIPTLFCLGTGILTGGIFGLVAGTVPSISYIFGLVEAGFSSAGSWAMIMMIWVSALGGIMSRMNAFNPIAEFIVKKSTKVRHLMTANYILCLLGNACFGDENSTIVTIGPITKEITDNNVEASEEDMYKLRLRNALFADAGGVYGSQIVPWHTFILFYVAVCNAVYPLYTFTPFDIIKYNFMSLIAVSSLFILTVTGWDRFIPLFKLPSEPDVKLKNIKNEKTNVSTTN